MLIGSDRIYLREEVLMCTKCTVYFMFKSGEMAPKGHIASKPPSVVGSVFIPTLNLNLCVSFESV